MATIKERKEKKNLTEKDWDRIDKSKKILGMLELVSLVAFSGFIIYMFLLVNLK